MRRLIKACICFFLLCLFVRGLGQTSQVFTSGTLVPSININGTSGCNYSWVNDNPSIGLPASGTGNIPAFTATNATSGPIMANITVIPPPSGYTYTSNFGSNSLSVIDNVTNKVVATIPIGKNPSGVVVTPDGKQVYVANDNDYTISVINSALNQVIKTIDVGAIPDQLAISPDGSKVYVPLSISNNITVISTATNTVTQVLPCQANPYAVAISPDGNFLYTSYGQNGSVITVLDLNTLQFGQSINTGTNYYGLAVSPDNKTLYAANYANDRFAVIDLASNSVIKTVPVAGAPYHLALNSDGSRLYVPGQWNDVVSVFNAADYQLLATIPAGGATDGVSVSPDDSRVYVVNVVSGDVTVISTATNTVIASVPVQQLPEAANNFVYGNSTCKQHSFTITINSGPTPVVTTSTVTGNIAGCVSSPGESPNVGLFTVAGTSLSGDITVTPPTGFDISLTAVGGYSPSLTLKQTGGAVISTTIYVRSSASDPVGPISGDIQVTTPGATPTPVAVTAIINALPTVNPVPDQAVNTGASTTPINFSGTANTFTWTNNNPAIGLPASGTGNIPSFTAGSSPAKATITVTPVSNSFAYITSFGSENVSVINTITKSFVTGIPAGVGPAGVSVSPDGRLVYITNENGGGVAVISTETNNIIKTFASGKSSFGLVVSPDGKTLYVANQGDNNISVFNTSSYALTTKINVGYNPYGIAVSPDGSKVYVTNLGAGSVSVINATTDQVVKTINVGPYPSGVAFSPDGSTAYVSNTVGGTVSIINTTTYSTTTITVGSHPTGIVVSPDGKNLYVNNAQDNTLWIINTATNAVINKIPVGIAPEGISVTPDDKNIYVVNSGSNDVWVIDTATGNVLAKIPVGINAFSLGNFITSGTGCPGMPITFTITVNSLTPTITANTPTGTISACEGTASATPNIEQFTVSGSNLTGDITATAPEGFDISLSPGSGYGNSIVIPQTAGAVNNVTVYIRSSASDGGSVSGITISGNVTLMSPGATDQTVGVTRIVYAPPTVNQVGPQSFTAGQTTTPVTFVGFTGVANWTNDMPGIGLPASGAGPIPAFTAIDPAGNTPVTATITVIPSTATSPCGGTPMKFTITINPALPPLIGASGSLTGLSTIYGTASSSDSFNLAGRNITAGILVTPPQGFEVSTDNTTFSSTVTAGQTGAINTKIYIRLAATTVVGNYTGNIVLSTPGGMNLDEQMPLSVVDRAPLTVIAPDVSRAYGVPNPVFVPQYQGFVNGDNQSALTTLPQLTTIATTNSQPGQYVIHVSGGSAPNYTLYPVDGTLTVVPSPSEIQIPNAFTPNGDGVNDFWNIRALIAFPQCLVSVYSRNGSLVFQSRGYAKPWDGTSNGSPVPVGTYYYIINPNLNGFTPIAGYVAVLR